MEIKKVPLIKESIFAFLVFVYSMVFHELVLSKLFIEWNFSSFYSKQLSYVVCAILILLIYKKTIINKNHHIKRILNISFDNKKALIALSIGLLSVPCSFLFNALEVLLVAQFSESSAMNLWNFQTQAVTLEPNKKLGGDIFIFITFTLVHAVITPLIEEITFRGIILTNLVHKYNYPIAVIITALLFTFIHPSNRYLDLLIFSMVAASVTLKTGHIIYAFMIHAGYNFLSWILEGHNVMLLFTNKAPETVKNVNTWNNELTLIIFIVPIALLLKALLKSTQKELNP